MDVLDIAGERPPEWQAVPDEIRRRLVAARGFYLPEEARLLDRILRADWLLLRNAHRFRCGRCNGVHDYFTLQCVERPFNRLSALGGLIRQQPEGTRDLLLDGLSLGAIVPISAAEAERLVWTIGLRGGLIPEWRLR